jgi:N-acetylglucosamine-6-phosphate deacetylase
MVKAAGGSLAFVTLAAELPGASDFVRVLRQAGVNVHLGHTKAPPEGVESYADWGIDGVTHIYDTFYPATVIEGGVYPLSLADACLAEPRLGLGLICDGVHVLPTQVRLLGQLPPDRVFLETDSMKFTGLPPGEFELYPGCVVRTSENSAARTLKGGLAGSCLTSDRGLRNWVKWTRCDLPRASLAASLNPARRAGRSADLGSLEPGKFADFIVLDDELNVKATYVSGHCVFGS